MISVIVPVFNESKTVKQFLTRLLRLQGNFEVIVVDGGSTDATQALVRKFKRVRLLTSQRGRAEQMNAGASIARGNLLLFLHADTQLPKNVFLQLETLKQVQWGAFYKTFDKQTPFLRFVCWRANMIRLQLFHLPFGDQVIFVRATLFKKLKGYPLQPLMEDLELSKNLRKTGKPYVITDPVVTSSRRFLEKGPLRMYLMMGYLRLLYFFGISAERLHVMYYKS